MLIFYLGKLNLKAGQEGRVSIIFGLLDSQRRSEVMKMHP